MRYSLWSHGLLVGHTDLDIHTITPHLRQGFVEPAGGGESVLRDATGVIRFMAEERRRQPEGGIAYDATYLDRFTAACDRREALDLELRDEAGQVFECEFMRVYDMYDMGSEWMDDELADDEATMSSADQEEIDAEVDEMLAAFNEAREHEDMFHSSWPPPPAEDERFEFMQYHLQVFLKGCFDIEEEF